MNELWVITDSNLSTGLVKKAEELAKLRDYELRHIIFSDCSIENRDRTLSELIKYYNELHPVGIIFEHTDFWGSIAPSFAALIQTGITADCTSLKWDEEFGLLQIRPTYGASKIAINRSLTLPYVVTIKNGVFENKESKYKNTRLENARIVLSGGLGIQSKENFSRLEYFASLIGAKVGATRAAVAAGFTNYSHQIGLSGITVRPEIYVAFGVSGAAQHLSGITTSKKIIAINNDKSAPIHNYADYSLYADACEVIECMIEKVLNKK